MKILTQYFHKCELWISVPSNTFVLMPLKHVAIGHFQNSIPIDTLLLTDVLDTV